MHPSTVRATTTGFLVVLVVAGSLLSGCLTISQAEIEAAYEDADERYHESYDAAQSMYFDRFTVPEGTATMEVQAIYKIDGTLEIKLEAPDDTDTRAFSISHGGFGRLSEKNELAMIDHPAPGPWSIEVVGKGNGTYTIGIWFHPGDE